ncbi:hypothetical protein KEM52_004538 [Ascosphaera acerosa]|nr:hypothetical protein KEM52_004538 [Ascosphaera acerosa]
MANFSDLLDEYVVNSANTLASCIPNHAALFGGPSRAALYRRPAITNLTKKVPYLSFEIRKDDLASSLAQLVLIGAGTSRETDIDKWKSYVLTYAMTVTPAALRGLHPEIFVRKGLSTGDCRDLKGKMSSLEAARQADDREAGLVALEGIFAHEALRFLPRPADLDLLFRLPSSIEPEISIGQYSAVILLMGNKVRVEHHLMNVLASLPAANARKGNAPASNSARSVLLGPCRLSRESHDGIFAGFSEMTFVRCKLLEHYSGYQHIRNNFTAESIWASMDLLQFTGMSYVGPVLTLLEDKNWVEDFPDLRLCVAAFRRDCVLYSKMHPALAPYAKLALSDTIALFKRSELDRLIAVARRYVKESNSTDKGRSDWHSRIISMSQTLRL